MKTSTPHDDRLEQLRSQIDAFSQDRDWGQFHTPKNLSMAMSVEVAELMEIFQWMNGDTRYDTLSAQNKQAVEHEVADIFMYLLRFCSVTGIDPIAAALAKMELNAQKYPADRAKGKSDKYTAYQAGHDQPSTKKTRIKKSRQSRACSVTVAIAQPVYLFPPLPSPP